MISTSFGPMRIFDAHTHFFSRTFYEQLGRQAGLKGELAEEIARKLTWDLPPEDPAEMGLQWVAEMDRHGVDCMVSIHTLPGDLDSAGAGVAAAAGRLAGYVMINPHSDDALKMLERAAAHYGFRGVALFPAMFRFSILSDATYAVLDHADRHAMNVFVHCGVLKVGFRTKLGLPSAFDGSLASPMMLQRPAAEFPRAKFILPHLGSGHFRELLMLADMAPNVYTDTSGVGGWAKYLDGSPTPAQVLRQAVDVMGAERLLFGSDSTFFPRGWRRDIFDRQLQIFEEAKLDEAQVRQILGENMEKLV